jgi:phenylalanyl-tRNA synthetase beta chain
MRTSLIPGIIQNIKRNLNRQIHSVPIFEIGKVYLQKDKEKIEENEVLCIGLCGMESQKIWNREERKWDFYDLKGMLEVLFNELNIDFEIISIKNIQLDEIEKDIFHPAKSGAILINSEYAGIIGEIEEAEDVSYKIYVSEIKLNMILKNYTKHILKSIPKYPFIMRDISLVVPDKINSQDIKNVISKVGGELVENIILFDYYSGKQLPQGTRGLAYRIYFRSKDKTLNDQTVDDIMKRIQDSLLDELSVKLRN